MTTTGVDGPGARARARAVARRFPPGCFASQSHTSNDHAPSTGAGSLRQEAGAPRSQPIWTASAASSSSATATSGHARSSSAWAICSSRCNTAWRGAGEWPPVASAPMAATVGGATGSWAPAPSTSTSTSVQVLAPERETAQAPAWCRGLARDPARGDRDAVREPSRFRTVPPCRHPCSAARPACAAAFPTRRAGRADAGPAAAGRAAGLRRARHCCGGAGPAGPAPRG